MTDATSRRFLTFRKQFMLRVLILFIITSTLVKYLNLLLAYTLDADRGYIENVAGMSLAKFARSVSWETALGIGLVATISATVAVAILGLINLLPERGVFVRGIGGLKLKREVITYALLLVTSGTIGVLGVVAAETMALLTFSPLVVFALLNPDWEGRYARSRISAALLLGVSTFALSGSKTIIFYLVLALTISALYSRRRRRWLVIGLVLVVVILYPYLNMFRGLAAVTSSKSALLATAAQVHQDFAASGPVQLFFNAYNAMLDRLVGLDGLLVATTFNGLTDLSPQDIAYELLGYQGTGISLSLLGQLYMQFGDIFLVAIVFPFVVVATWRVAVIVDAHLTAQGFASFGTLLYLKTVMFLIGGFRWVDMKLIATAILVVVLSRLVWYVLIVAGRGERPRVSSAPTRAGRGVR